MKGFLAVLVFLISFSTVFSQTVKQENNSYIIKSFGSRAALEAELNKSGDYKIKDQIPFTDIFLIEDVSGNKLNTSSDLMRLYNKIYYASLNGHIELRDKEPNDPQFQNQWLYDLIHGPAAWDYGTGGVTCRGDSIVIAVQDQGFEIKHEDLIQNLWKNKAEIPGDGKDNDNDGYIDDVFGLNTGTNNDVHQIQSHGTKVAGILGARGNNNKGIVGINWSCKIMYISDLSNGDFSAIKGMHYILLQRRRYNNSNGKEGAFVVSLNQSFGIGGAKAEDHEMWCSMYDSLGIEGVLTAGATANSNSDVDIIGDIPSTCTSNYLVVVTNMGQNDKKASAGYGLKSVDMGAFGVSVLSTDLDDQYSASSSGTSFATPEVAGAMALVYSTQCCKLADLALTDPPAAALLVKSFIFNGGLNNSTLKDITTTGKRLDLAGMIENMLEYCGNNTGNGNVNNISLKIANQEILFNVTLPAYKEYRYTVSDDIGRYLKDGTIAYTAFGQNEFKVDIAGIIPGIYVLTIWDDKNPISKKFIKLE